MADLSNISNMAEPKKIWLQNNDLGMVHKTERINGEWFNG